MAIRQIDWRALMKTIFLHILFWLFIVTYFAWGFGFTENPKRSFLNASFFLPGFFLMVYSLLYILIPKFLIQRKFLKFFTGLLAVLFICILYTILAKLSLEDSKTFRGMTWAMGRNVLPFLHVAGFAISIRLFFYWYDQKRQTLEAEKQKTVAELQLLKAQLHPHFLFNTLNNLYSYTLEESPRCPEIVLKLSELLRFMIYESNTPKMPLKTEIQVLQNYISLEEMRYGDRLDISVSIDGDIEKYQIAPFLLLPFLENAFKHGTSKQLDQCWISLNISILNSEMEFKLVNSIEPQTDEEQIKPGGLGLMNVKKRLELLYKNKHSLETKRLEEVFVVTLAITLEELEEKYEKMAMSYSG